MAARGPRGDITVESILHAADRLLVDRGRVEGISLRGVAAEVGVAVNALYTYFPSLDAIWQELADQRLGRLHPTELLDRECPHCALLELADRAVTVLATPGTISLLRKGPVLGRCSFVLSETIMTLTEHGSLDSRDAHDLVVGWFYGSSVLDGEGWTSGTDTIRDTPSSRGLPADREPKRPRPPPAGRSDSARHRPGLFGDAPTATDGPHEARPGSRSPMTEPDIITIQWLNLLHGSPSFVIRIDPHTDAPTVVQVEIVPKDDGVYWIAGTTTLPRGDRIPSVFEVDTSAGGSLAGVHWKIDGGWISSSEKRRALSALDAEEGEVFPFDWTYAIPLAQDIYHDTGTVPDGTP